MNELLMMEAALFQLRSLLTSDASDSNLLPIRLSAEVLAGAVATAKEEGINPARVGDIEFALADLVAAIEEADASDPMRATVDLLQKDAATLRSATALPLALVAAIRDLQGRLKARAAALERGQYRLEGIEEAPLPHPPAELRQAAIPVARDLATAGFTTPVLDALVADPDSLLYHSINELVDELEVIARGHG